MGGVEHRPPALLVDDGGKVDKVLLCRFVVDSS